jgi:hypothetical protein
MLDGVLARGRVAEAVADAAWLRAMLRAEAALARARGLPEAVAGAILAARVDVRELGRRAAESGNPVVPLVAALREQVGPDVHRGGTSQDVLDTALLLLARDAIAAIDADLVAAVADAYRRRPGRRVRYACAVWRDPWLWLGRRTYAADLLGLAGGEPVLDDPATRYPRLELDTVAGLDPELVLLPSEPYAFGKADADELAAAFGGARVELVDGRALTWYGPRIPAALASFRELLASSP